MKFNPDKGYEKLWSLDLGVNEPADSPKRKKVQELFNELEHFDKPEDMEVFDEVVPAEGDDPAVKIRVYRKKGAVNAPLVFDIHGGGFVIGNLDKDNNRCAAICAGVPCTVIQVEYRLAPQYRFPAPLMDCYHALTYVAAHAEHYGIDPERIALFGSSAGGTLVAGLALYIRDKGGPKISMLVFNYPCFYRGDPKSSAMLMFDGAPVIGGENLNDALNLYMGPLNGGQPSYYAVPGECKDLTHLPPTAIIAAEYCPLRDDSIDFARRLLANGIPTELYLLPRVPHAYDLIKEPRTKWIQEGIFLSLRREFGMN